MRDRGVPRARVLASASCHGDGRYKVTVGARGCAVAMRVWDLQEKDACAATSQRHSLAETHSPARTPARTDVEAGNLDLHEEAAERRPAAASTSGCPRMISIRREDTRPSRRGGWNERRCVRVCDRGLRSRGCLERHTSRDVTSLR